MPNKIFVIGCGGVGSWLVPSLCLLEDRRRITVVDGDTLEAKNLNRQLFTDKDIGRNKAEALAQRYGCGSVPRYYSSGSLDAGFGDWLIVCVDNHKARNESLIDCDIYNCSSIFSCNETHSAEAFVFLPLWRKTPLDPRVYYPEIATDTSNDPRSAAIGCTGAAQRANPQLVSANFMAASLAQWLYVLWATEISKMDDPPLERLPFKLVSNMSKLESHMIGDKLQTENLSVTN